MRIVRSVAAASLAGLLTLAGAALAETKVEVKGVHLCCKGCVKGVAAALKSIDGVKPECDQKNGSVTITATDGPTAQKALDALAAAGYYGDTGDKSLAIKETAGVPAGKAKSVTLAGIHNCCGACCKAIKKAVKSVDGVSGDTAKPKATEFEVTGDFEPAALIKALKDAGFSAEVK